MKKFFTYFLLVSFAGTVFSSCGRSSTKGILGGANVGGTVVKTVATVVGLILLSKLLKSVLGTLGESTSFAGLTNTPGFKTNFTEDTKLSSIAQTDLMKVALQAVIAQKYKIPFQTVASNYGNLVTAGDLATFIGKNADASVLQKIK